MTTTYNLISVKGDREFTGTREEAIAAAIAMEEELQPSFGVTVEDAAGETVAEIRDGVDMDADEEETGDVRCACGTITGVACEWSGAESETVNVEWMPEHLRASHEAAGNRGSYPHNGSQHLTLNRECAESLADDWTEIVE